jgi:2-amino-4-hydroxy-6-hydroxymethyldihydropteridine diphosphokinase
MAIYIALGSNLGDKEKNLKEALLRLAKKGIKICKVSDFIATRPYGVTDQPDFLNAVAEVETDISPAELLQVLLQTEREMGRLRLRRWGERNIDLDLLLYDGQTIDLPELKVPHPDMQNREFVLKPLAQIAPDAVHPKLGKTIGQMWKELQ